ncbi:chemotaxis protein [archaeon]|nr:chemotaxis protein [archaeon]
MAVKITKKKTTDQAKKTTKKEPTPAAVLKKVALISDSNKALQKEIKVMTKIFGENQKVLISMKEMIDMLASTLEHIQKQSKQINTIEDDTQKLYAGLNQVRTQTDLVDKINEQTTKLEKEISEITEIQKASKPQETSQQLEDNTNSIRNNSQMIIKIAQRIDEVKDNLREISRKTDSFLEIGLEIDNLKNNIKEVSDKTAKLGAGTQIVKSLKQEFEKITEEVAHTSNLNAELDAIKTTIDSISSKASKIDSLGSTIEGLKQQFDSTLSKVNSADGINEESMKKIGIKIDQIETKIGTLVQKTESTAVIGKEIKSVQNEVSNFKQDVFGKTNNIEREISEVSDILKKQDTSTNELHKKSEKLFEEIQEIRYSSDRESEHSSKEMMGLLKLSEYQSSIRMNSESKYGTTKDIEKMASQTIEIVNLFDRISDEDEEKIPLPQEVRQWAVSKMLDCADKWEIRFGDVYSILSNTIGRDMLKESIRIQQIRDIYGIRAVDEIRKDLNIT